MAKRKYKNLEQHLRDMEVGEEKMVIVGPGQEGRVLVKKGKHHKVPTLIRDINRPRTRAKVIRRRK